MKNGFLLLALTLGLSHAGMAQQSSPLSAGDYMELTDTKPHDSAEKWEKLSSAVQLSWGTTNIRYPKLSIPEVNKQTRFSAQAWRGERVNAQAVLWTRTGLEGATVTVSDLKNGSAVIPASAVTTNFVRYVMTDELNKDGKGGCGHRPDPSAWDSSVVADALDILPIRAIEANTTQPIWVNVWVPQTARPGTYKGTVTVSGANFSPMNLQLEIQVLNRTLPDPSEWVFHLDLWQNPYAVARYYDVPLWSQEHFDIMKPLFTRLKNAGQKVITTSIMHKPWDGQTYDHFDSMIFRMKKLDGSWEYDYTIFDKWVDFMINEVGITKQINCFGIIPWALRFDYFDQATNRVLFIEAKPGEPAYEEYWLGFLKDFSKHLREKGWFDRTTITIDERGLDAMQNALRVIKKADPEFKLSAEGHYHGEIQADLYELCLAYGHNFPADVREERRQSGKLSTVYTCCSEAFPNTFTFSPPVEGAFIGWHTMAEDYDGYLRWAYNSWTEDPLRDSRFRTWAAGDCYMVYPDNRSSIRLERLIEGFQDYEKIRILKEEFKKNGNTGKLKKLNDTLKKFTAEEVANHQPLEKTLEGARKTLNSL